MEVLLDLNDDGLPLWAEVATEDVPRIFAHLDMKTEPHKSVQQFKLGETFQAEYDAWKAKVENEGRGILDVVHRDVVSDGQYLLITWRVVPRLHLSRR